MALDNDNITTVLGTITAVSVAAYEQKIAQPYTGEIAFASMLAYSFYTNKQQPK